MCVYIRICVMCMRVYICVFAQDLEGRLLVTEGEKRARIDGGMCPKCQHLENRGRKTMNSRSS